MIPPCEWCGFLPGSNWNHHEDCPMRRLDYDVGKADVLRRLFALEKERDAANVLEKGRDEARALLREVFDLCNDARPSKATVYCKIADALFDACRVIAFTQPKLPQEIAERAIESAKAHWPSDEGTRGCALPTVLLLRIRAVLGDTECEPVSADLCHWIDWSKKPAVRCAERATVYSRSVWGGTNKEPNVCEKHAGEEQPTPKPARLDPHGTEEPLTRLVAQAVPDEHGHTVTGPAVAIEDTRTGERTELAQQPAPEPAGAGPRLRFLIRPQGEHAWCLVDRWDDLRAHVEDGDGSLVWEVRTKMMTDAEVEAMGEFDGW